MDDKKDQLDMMVFPPPMIISKSAPLSGLTLDFRQQLEVVTETAPEIVEPRSTGMEISQQETQEEYIQSEDSISYLNVVEPAKRMKVHMKHLFVPALDHGVLEVLDSPTGAKDLTKIIDTFKSFDKTKNQISRQKWLQMKKTLHNANSQTSDMKQSKRDHQKAQQAFEEWKIKKREKEARDQEEERLKVKQEEMDRKRAEEERVILQRRTEEAIDRWAQEKEQLRSLAEQKQQEEINEAQKERSDRISRGLAAFESWRQRNKGKRPSKLSVFPHAQPWVDTLDENYRHGIKHARSQTLS